MMSWTVKSAINKKKLISLISLFSQAKGKGIHTERRNKNAVHFLGNIPAVCHLVALQGSENLFHVLISFYVAEIVSKYNS